MNNNYDKSKIKERELKRKYDGSKPSFSAPPEEVAVPGIELVADVGSDVLLPCNATGYPPPKVTWTPPLQQTQRYTLSDAGVTISSVAVSDQNAYTCEVSNVFGKTSTTVILNVKGQPGVILNVKGQPGVILNVKGQPGVILNVKGQVSLV